MDKIKDVKMLVTRDLLKAAFCVEVAAGTEAGSDA